MTTAQDNPVRPGRAASTQLDDTPARYAALHMVNQNEISWDGILLRRRDSADLEPGVFAALVALQSDGYVELPEPVAADRVRHPQRSARLSLRGMQLLSRFSLERARHDSGAVTVDHAR